MKKPIDELRKNAHGKFVEKGMKDTDVLVIDEILMVEAHFIERLNIALGGSGLQRTVWGYAINGHW